MKIHKNKLKLPKFAALCVLALIALLLIPKPDESYFKDRAVMLRGNGRSCTGEQITAPSGKNYILTAAHCNALASTSNTISVETEDHIKSEHRIIAEDPNSDLLLLEGLPGLSGLSIAEQYEEDKDVRTFTHGKGFATYKTTGRIIQLVHIDIAVGVAEEMGEKCTGGKYKIMTDAGLFGVSNICVLSLFEMATTAKVVPGSSGGMVVDTDGRLVGVVSATDENFGYLVPLSDIKKFIAGY